MSSVTVLVPVLNRPERVDPLVTSLRGSQKDVELRLMFIATRDDTTELEAIWGRGDYDSVVALPGPRAPGDYARKMNYAYSLVLEDRDVLNADDQWVFLGADDLCFCHGWADEALKFDSDFVDVIGTNDLGNPLVTSGQHATHSLVRVGYLGTIDNPDLLLHDGYRHNWVDTEFIATAKSRDLFAMAHGSHVEHLHPHWGFGEYDETYRLGLADFDVDRQLFQQRQRLWQ